MTPLFKKLNFKNQSTILAINAPDSFQPELAAMESIARVIHDLKKIKEIEFLICFLNTQKAINEFAKNIQKKLEGDPIIWICYPKGSSKKHTCDFNRDTGWDSLGAISLEPVRQVAIDEDWSALRFRKVENIKTITRRESFALSREAKKRTTQKGK